MTDEIKAARAGAQDLSEDERRWIEALQTRPQRPVVHVKRRRLSKSQTPGERLRDDHDQARGTASAKQARTFNLPTPIDRNVGGSADKTDSAGSEGVLRPPSPTLELKRFRRRRNPLQRPGPVNWIVSKRPGSERFDGMPVDVDGSRAPGIESSSEYRVTVMALETLRKTLEEVRAAQRFVL